MNHYMGVDVGTSGCKAVVFDTAGKQVAVAYREYDLHCPHPGWAELDSDEVMRKCFDVIGEAARQVPSGTVRGLGVSAQGEAFTPLDAQGKSLGPAPVSSDARAATYVVEWTKQFGLDNLYQITGHTAHTMFSLFKLLWMRDHQPEVWKRAARFLCFEDLLHARLGIDPAIGWPLAARMMLFDVRKHQWHDDLMNAAGLKRGQLARPLESGSVAGKVPANMARELGLADNAVVVTAGHDQPCSALGAGAVEPGVAVYATGTVECITPAFKEPRFTDVLKANNLCTYHHCAPGRYATVAFSLTGGNILKWFRDQFGAAEVAEQQRTGTNAYELLLREAGGEPSDLLVLPYFTPTGTPYFDPHATGAILGLRLTTTRGQVIRALLEGVAFEMRLNLDLLAQSGLPITQLRAIGGGAKSATWNQLNADVLGVPLAVSEVTEAGARGAAMLACAADTGEPVVQLASRWTKISGEVRPRKAQTERYTERFATYKKLYPTLRGLR